VLVAMLERSEVLSGTARGWLFRILAPLCILGALLTGSRAGAALLLPALIAGFVLARGRIRLGRTELALVLGLVAIVAIGLVLSPGGRLAAILSRSYVAEDDRYRFWPAVVSMIEHYAPWGMGLGSFPYAYEVTEPNNLLSALWLNHAHNDWLEYLSETGVPGALLALGFVVWLVLRLWPARRSSRAPSRKMAYGAGAVIVLLLAHSGYDYPLRTVTIAALFAVMLALMAPAGALAPTSGNDQRGSTAARRLIVAGGAGVVAVAMILQCAGFSAALSDRPQFGARVPLAGSRAAADTALRMALRHAPANLVANMAARSGRQSPLDEPAITALALTETDPARAAALFAEAHILSRHDPVLLSALFTRARNGHDPVAELAAFDELARQQVEVPQQDAALARDMGDPRLQAMVADSLVRGAPWRGHFIDAAARDPGALDNLTRLAAALQHGPAPLIRDERAPLIGALLKGSASNQDQAWQLWRALAPAADPLDWNIAASDRTPLPFDWTFEGRTGPGDHGAIVFDNSDGSATIVAVKTVVLSAPAFRFVVTGDSQGVALRLDCKGQASWTPAGGKVILPPGCKVAQIAIVAPNRSGTLRAVRLVNDSP
jgi:hypothetical protein